MNPSEPTVPPSRVSRRAVLLVVVLLIAAALAAYRNTFHAPFVLDDADSVTENASLHHLWPLWQVLAPPAGGATVSGRPVFNLSLALNYAVSGDAVWSYHALNLLIHLLAACSLFGLVRRSLGLRSLRARFGSDALPLAAAVSGIWLLHPLQTAAVTYVSQRAESLAGLFCLFTLYAFVRSVEAGATRSRSWQTVSCAACLVGMATKEITAALPLLVLIFDAAFVTTGPTGGYAAAWRRRRAYYLALAATWGLLAALVFGTHSRGGTVGFGSGLSSYAYLLTQCRAIVTYLKLSLWPHPLVFDYGLSISHTLVEVWPQALLIVALLAATVTALWRRSAAGFLGAWFFGILAPSSSFVPIATETMAEHRMYLPLAAIVTACVLVLHVAFRQRSLWLWPAAFAALGITTFVRNNAYRSDLTLWRDTVEKAPGNGRAHFNLSNAYSERHRFAEAVVEDEAALRFDTGWSAADQRPMLLNKLGYDLEQLGRHEEAVARLLQALTLRPSYPRANFNLARSLVKLGRTDEALPHFAEALRLEGDDAGVEAEFANALMLDGHIDDAIAHYRHVLSLAPKAEGACSNLAYALLLSGRVDDSVAAYRQAVTLSPNDASAWMGLGYALVNAGRPGEAIAPCEEAVKREPSLADAHNILGIAYAQAGRTADAIACFRRALALNPRGADIHNNLGNALDTAERHAEAVAEFREALRLNPDYAPAHRSLAQELRREGLDAEAAQHTAIADRLESEGASQVAPDFIRTGSGR